MTLRELGVGKCGRVLSVGGEKVLRHRLLEMGITPRTSITIKKAAPMGDPIELLLRGYVLTLRLEEAGKITVEEIPPEAGGDSYGSAVKSEHQDHYKPDHKHSSRDHRGHKSRGARMSCGRHGGAGCSGCAEGECETL